MSRLLADLRIDHRELGKKLAMLRGERDRINGRIESTMAFMQDAARDILALENAQKALPVATPSSDLLKRQETAFESVFGTGDDRDVSIGGFAGLV